MEEIGHPPPAPACATFRRSMTRTRCKRALVHEPVPSFSILCRSLDVANDARAVDATTIAASREVS